MNYQLLKSLVASRKVPLTPSVPTESFFVCKERPEPYIEPTFSKVEFPIEKPSILLVSAIAVSGKTTTAKALSFDLGLPILDLTNHKAVGDNTLTGVITNAYPIDDVGGVLQGLRSGTNAVLIDGLDEGRSKTTIQAFDAFLDDLIQRSSASPAPAIVVFGRGQVLLDAWCHLEDSGASVGMLRLDPFSREHAKTYIDESTAPRKSGQEAVYEEARDEILERLGVAFGRVSPGVRESDRLLLSFIGYPPVLDAICTLLSGEANYHKTLQALHGTMIAEVEMSLLMQICEHLLTRDYQEKALPNFIEPLAREAGGDLGEQLRTTLYTTDEQCARVLTRSLGRNFPHRIIHDDTLHERYEESVDKWLCDHPFWDEDQGNFRNVVFSSFAVACCSVSKVAEYRDLAHDYSMANQSTHHLLYFVKERVADSELDARFFSPLIEACGDFVGIGAEFVGSIDGVAWDDAEEEEDPCVELDVCLRFPSEKQEETFLFKGQIHGDTIPVGPRLVNTSITVPYDVDLFGRPTLEIRGECSVSARGVTVNARDIDIRRDGGMPRVREEESEDGLFVDARTVRGHVDSVSARYGTIEIQCDEHTLGYQLARYVRNREKKEGRVDDEEREKKRKRLRRILSEFASHKKGKLGKYRAKIEHRRVLRGELGERILDALRREGVIFLSKDTKFYLIDGERLAGRLGISWPQLRRQEWSAELDRFLDTVS